ncbi:MAG TPA: DUF4982 domain-containing protein [Candidatus Methylacidiphilales bacterium]|nr:DUF4982 domain-containing protein [Candidatus Methylacidiphilales bacterium]
MPSSLKSKYGLKRPSAWLVCWILLGWALTLSGGRATTLNFDPDWKFIKADPPQAQMENFDDSSWTTVSAPHTFNDTDTFIHWSVAAQGGEIGQWSGRTWYRKTFLADNAWKGQKVIIEFEAARQVAEVYLNGHFLGKSENGFMPFGFDLTSYLHFGTQPNVLAVMCDNRFGKNNPFPWNDPHWQPAHGGLYRNVYLHILNPVHFTLPLYSNLGTVGIYNYASDLKPDSAVVHVEAEVQNETDHDVGLSYQGDLLDEGGHVVLTLTTSGNLKAGAKTILTANGTLSQPRRWSPDYPYVYTLRSQLGSGQTIWDQQETPLGFREAQWTMSQGLFLNGNHVKLHGWGQKPTDEWAGLGAAMPDWMHFYTLQLMREAGGNFVRWGHCAAGPAMVRAADQLGIVTEQPGVDGEHDATGYAWTVRLAAWRDMIIYYRNNPAILIWEGGNQSVTEEHVQELTSVVNQYDPHGGRAYGQRRADAIVEKYSQVSIGTEGQISPRLPTIEGEYDREESPRRVWDNDSPPDFGYLAGKGQTYDLTSEQYALNEITQYLNKIGMPSHTGGANWIFSDSTCGGRNTSEVTRASGEVDGVRLPKEAYYVCQVMFREDPQVHIIGHWTYPPERNVKKNIYVVSNGDKVELALNGKSLGFGQRKNRFLFVFPNVAWEAGTLEAKAYKDNQVVKTDTLKTAGAPVALRMTAMTSPKGFRATGSDIALIDVEAVDARGERCPTYQDRVNFALTGAAIWRGGYNSGKLNSTNNLWLDLEAGINRVALKSTLSGGPVHLVASAQELKSATIDLTSIPVPLANGATTEMPPVPAPPDFSSTQEPAMGPGPSSGANAPVMAQNLGAYTGTFAYTGPTPGAEIKPDAQNGEPAYASEQMTFAGLPSFLVGADYAQLPPKDSQYGALDLISLSVKEDAVIYIAHDSLLANPKWLTDAFKSTGQTLSFGGHTYALFQHAASPAESLTLGGNQDGVPQNPNAAMYIVFIAKP